MGSKNFDFEIPFGAKDSELIEATYYIPEGMEAVIEDNKVVIRKKESEDEKTRKWIIAEIKATHDYDSPTSIDCVDKAIAWLEKQGGHKESEYPIDVIENAISLLHDRNNGMPIEEARGIVNAIVSALKWS